jgi:hypothetical protein
MTASKKENLFAKLAVQNAKAAHDEETIAAPVEEVADPSPALPEPVKQKPAPARKKPEQVKGKRDNPDYCQANAYILKRIRRAVDRQLLDIEGMDYSSLVEDLLRKWLKSRGVSE